jgi:ABC-type lipopolysaccharide export system ATPase subunit
MALTLAGRGYLLHVGTIVARGTADALMRDDLIERAYLTETRR